MKSKYLIAILLIVLIAPVFWFLSKPGFITTDDGNWMIIRFSAFYQALRDGQFPVRFLGRLNFGYGYPVADFLYPGFMYLAVPLKVAGLSFVTSVKIIIAASMIFSGLFTYFWLSRRFDNISAFFGSLFYIYAPYHLYDFVKRGSVGELLSLAILPFVLWQVDRQSLFWSALGLTFLLISHNTLAILFIGLTLLYMGVCLLGIKNKKPLLRFFAKVLLFGFGISSFFILPAVFELPNTVFFKTKISDFAKYFADYNLVGITTFIIFAGALLVLISKKGVIKKNTLTLLMFILGLATIFFATFPSSIIWQALPVSFIQFPFRMLSVTIVCAAFLLAFIIFELPRKFGILIGIVILAATAWFSKDYLLPTNFNLSDDSFYSTNEATTTVADEYMPVWVVQKPIGHFMNKVEVIRGKGVPNNILHNSKEITFDYNSVSPSVVRINTIYYPGWTASSNGTEKAIFYDNRFGVMDLKLIAGNQKIKLTFGEAPARLVSDGISVVSFIILLFVTFKKPATKKNKA